MNNARLEFEGEENLLELQFTALKRCLFYFIYLFDVNRLIILLIQYEKYNYTVFKQINFKNRIKNRYISKKNNNDFYKK